MLDNELNEFMPGESLLGRDFRQMINDNDEAAIVGIEVEEPLMKVLEIGGGITLGLNVEEIVAMAQDRTDDEFWAKITGSDGIKHAWSELFHDGVGVFTVKPGGRTGTTGGAVNDRTAYEANGRKDVPTGTIVRMSFSSQPGQDSFEFDLIHGLEDSPATLGSSGEAEAAMADTWDVESQGANTGLTETVLYRMAYTTSGDQILYAYYRNRTLDSNGLLLRVSAETRVTIDTPVVCP